MASGYAWDLLALAGDKEAFMDMESELEENFHGEDNQASKNAGSQEEVSVLALAVPGLSCLSRIGFPSWAFPPHFVPLLPVACFQHAILGNLRTAVELPLLALKVSRNPG